MIPTWLPIGFAVFVTLVWAAAGAWGSFSGDYTFVQLATPVVMIVAGFVAAVVTVRKPPNGKNGNGPKR